MPTLGKRQLKQDAVYWAKSGVDARAQATVSAGIAIKVRWEFSSGETLNATNDRVATVGTVVVDRDIKEGSIFWEGKLDDHISGTSKNYYRVIAFSKIPNIKGKNPRRVATLQRHGDSLPTIA